MNFDVQETTHFSWKTGELAKGCRQCVKGQKVVIFITGLCSQRCFYCPISEKKFSHDIAYANEWQIKNPDNPVELIEEVTLCGAKGAGITGGDPLMNVDRCCQYIKLLKETFGKDFHIHLYTPMTLVTKERLQKLARCGLDEIRFHLDLKDNSLWDRVLLAKEFGWKVGVEIPVIPGCEQNIQRIIDYIADKVDFLNLNELEMSDTEAPHYDLSGFKPKDELSYGVKESEELGKKLLEHCSEKKLSCHLCSVKLKDDVQVVQRLINRAKNCALSTDEVTDQGTFIRGCIYLPEIAPDRVGYRKLLKEYTEKRAHEMLTVPFKQLSGLSDEELFIDTRKVRLITSCEFVQKHSSEIRDRGFIPAIVEEFPTVDGLEVEVEYL